MADEDGTPWATVPPLVLEGIGAALASFNQADLLRARLACKHWHTSLSRCLPKVTLYHTPTSLPTSAGHIDKPLLHALQPPLTLQTPHAGSVATTGTAALPPQPAPPSSAALPSLLPSLHHITIACRNLDPADLPYLASACPSLSHLTLRPGRYTPAPEPPAPPNSSPPAAPIDPTNPTDPSPANPALLPHTLNSLTLYVTRDTPWDMLQLLTGSAAPQASSIPPSPSPLPVQELCIRRHPAVPPPSSHSDQPVRHASCTVDLTPLLHPQLAGLTFLELATIKQSVSRERGAVTVSAQQGAAGPGAGGGLLGIGGGIGGGLVGLGVDGGDGRGRERDGDAEVACGVALLARLQQLRSLVVADEQVELGALERCFRSLTALQRLALRGGVLCEQEDQLHSLLGLTGLVCLELDFRSEWWLTAGDLARLSALRSLRELRLRVSYAGEIGSREDDYFDFVEERANEWCELPAAAGQLLHSGPGGGGGPAGGAAVPASKAGSGASGPQELLMGMPGLGSIAQAAGSSAPPPQPRFVGQQPLGNDAGGSSHSEAVGYDRTSSGSGGGGASSWAPPSLEAIGQQLQREWEAWGCRVLGVEEEDAGESDDWRALTSGLTQLRVLQLGVSCASGRKLAEAVHVAVPYMGHVEGQLATAGRVGDDDWQRQDRGGGGEVSSAGRRNPSRGICLTLDSQAGSICDVEYWAGAVRRAPYVPPPLARLELTGGHSLEMAGAHFLCLGLMTELRWLEIRCVVHPREMAIAAAEAAAGERIAVRREGGAVVGNPLLALARLSRLRVLRLHLKVPRVPEGAVYPPWGTSGELRQRLVGKAGSDRVRGSGGEPGACTVDELGDDITAAELALGLDGEVEDDVHAEDTDEEEGNAAYGRGGGGAAGGFVAHSGGGSSEGHKGGRRLPSYAPVPMQVTDEVVAAWMYGMPALRELGVRAAGQLGEEGLAAIGRHTALGTLRLRLRPRPAPPSMPRVSTTHGSANPHSDHGLAAADPAGTVRVGYGYYYTDAYGTGEAAGAAPEASMAASAADGAGGREDGSVTPLGVSPPVGAVAGLAAWVASGAAGPPPLPLAQSAATGGGRGSVVGVPEASAADRWAAKDSAVAAGVDMNASSLRGVPYIIRPYHLPPSLTHLDLTNAAFAAAEWAQMAGLGNSIANSTTSSSNLPGPAGTDGSSRGPGHSGESGAGAQEAERGCGSSGGAEAPAAGEQLPLLPPRLVTLRLTHKRPRGARRRAVSSAGGGPGSSSCVPGAPDPTRLTDWHMVMLPRLLPTLSHVSLHDAEPDGGWLHRRALAHLGRCRDLHTAALGFGDRLRRSTQEALFASLPPGLRRLHLHSSNLYAEALAQGTRLTNLVQLKVSGPVHPVSYVGELHRAAAAVAGSALACTPVLHLCGDRVKDIGFGDQETAWQ